MAEVEEDWGRVCWGRGVVLCAEMEVVVVVWRAGVEVRVARLRRARLEAMVGFLQGRSVRLDGRW